ncbi:hypothetical protein MUP59_09415 [Candidatus Bathyarchaeota archaeon]|nr:hypothetical protein [Candidatus Bathyarchaeota archaeon]
MIKKFIGTCKCGWKTEQTTRAELHREINKHICDLLKGKATAKKYHEVIYCSKCEKAIYSYKDGYGRHFTWLAMGEEFKARTCFHTEGMREFIVSIVVKCPESTTA